MQNAVDPSAPADLGSVEQIYSTNEGPVVITTRGKLVFVSESFPLPLARRLTTLILDAQGGGAMRMAAAPMQFRAPVILSEGRRAAGVEEPAVALSVARAGNRETSSSLPAAPTGFSSPNEPGGALSADLVHFFESCGVMKAAVDAELRAVRR